MTIDARNSEAADHAAQWEMMRHVLGGSHEMREHSERYIPRLSDQTSDEYLAYVQRPAFLEATARTSEAFAGIIFRKSPTVDGLDNADWLEYDVDTSGKSLLEFAQNIVDEQLATNWGVIVVSHSGDPNNPGTADRPSGRPVLSYYPAEAIIAWTFGPSFKDGQPAQSLTSVRVWEDYTVIDPDDEFSREVKQQIRVLDLDKASLFRDRIFRLITTEKGKQEWRQISIAEPMKAGQRMTFVPAVAVSGSGKRCPSNPLLAPIAEINVSHWRTLADLEHGAHFCGLPTPYVTGVSTPTRRSSDVMSAIENGAIVTEGSVRAVMQRTEEPSIRLGSSRIMTLENVQAKAGYMEFTGQGLASLERLADRKEAQMAALGARMLAPEKSAAESGDALAIRKSSETSPLVKMVRFVSDALTAAVNIALDWAGLPAEAIFELNSDFAETQLSPEEITALVTAWQGGAISHDTLLYNFQRGGRLPEGRTTADEIEVIGTEAPAQRDTFSDPLAGIFNGGGAQ